MRRRPVPALAIRARRRHLRWRHATAVRSGDKGCGAQRRPWLRVRLLHDLHDGGASPPAGWRSQLVQGTRGAAPGGAHCLVATRSERSCAILLLAAASLRLGCGGRHPLSACRSDSGSPRSPAREGRAGERLDQKARARLPCVGAQRGDRLFRGRRDAAGRARGRAAATTRQLGRNHAACRLRRRPLQLQSAVGAIHLRVCVGGRSRALHATP